LFELQAAIERTIAVAASILNVFITLLKILKVADLSLPG
jgi:hypothetical protein